MSAPSYVYAVARAATTSDAALPAPTSTMTNPAAAAASTPAYGCAHLGIPGRAQFRCSPATCNVHGSTVFSRERHARLLSARRVRFRRRPCLRRLPLSPTSVPVPTTVASVASRGSTSIPERQSRSAASYVSPRWPPPPRQPHRGRRSRHSPPPLRVCWPPPMSPPTPPPPPMSRRCTLLLLRRCRCW